MQVVDVGQDRQREWAEVAASVFLAPRLTDEEFESRRPRYSGQRLRAAVEDDRVVATFRSFDTSLTLPGGAVAANAVSSVTVLPTHRRRGLLTAMMATDLADADERGAAVSILIAAEAPIYGRFGFGPAADTAAWRVDAHRARFARAAPGSLEVLAPEQLRPHAPGVYTAARTRQPGAIDRSDLWWDAACATVPPPGGVDRALRAVLYRDLSGRPQGFATYTVDASWELNLPRATLEVKELVAATDDAYARLWQFCCEVDLVATVSAKDRSVGEVLPWLLQDRRAVLQTSRSDFLWVRVHDPAAALTARRWYSPARLVLEVVGDGSGAGRWALDVDDAGNASCRRTSATADLTLPAATLGAAYLGGHRLSVLAQAGWLDEHTPGAVAGAQAALSSPHPPWCGTWF